MHTSRLRRPTFWRPLQKKCGGAPDLTGQSMRPMRDTSIKTQLLRNGSAASSRNQWARQHLYCSLCLHAIASGQNLPTNPANKCLQGLGFSPKIRNYLRLEISWKGPRSKEAGPVSPEGLRNGSVHSWHTVRWNNTAIAMAPFSEKTPASMTETLAATWKAHLCVSQAVSKRKDSDTLRLISYLSKGLLPDIWTSSSSSKGRKSSRLIRHLAAPHKLHPPKFPRFIVMKTALLVTKTCDMEFSDEKNKFASNASKSRGRLKAKPYAPIVATKTMKTIVHWMVDSWIAGCRSSMFAREPSISNKDRKNSGSLERRALFLSALRESRHDTDRGPTLKKKLLLPFTGSLCFG